MAKPKEKLLVLITWDKDDFQMRGFNILFRRTWYLMPIVFLMLVLSFVVGKKDIIIGDILFFSSFGVFVIWYSWIYFKGKQFWNENKNMEQPIKIEPLPKFWGNKK